MRAQDGRVITLNKCKRVGIQAEHSVTIKELEKRIKKRKRLENVFMCLSFVTLGLNIAWGSLCLGTSIGIEGFSRAVTTTTELSSGILVSTEFNSDWNAIPLIVGTVLIFCVTVCLWLVGIRAERMYTKYQEERHTLRKNKLEGNNG